MLNLYIHLIWWFCFIIHNLVQVFLTCAEGRTMLQLNDWFAKGLLASDRETWVVDRSSLAKVRKGTCLMACQSALSGKRGSSYVIDHSEQTWTCQRCYSRLLCPDHSVGVFFQKLQSDNIISLQASGN